MEDSKNYSRVYSLILIVSIFAGWQAMLLVSALLLIFGKVDEDVKKVIITVICFAAGIALFNVFWDLITDGVALVIKAVETIVDFLNSYLDKPIMLLKLRQYLFNPIEIVLGFLTSALSYAITFMRFCFIIALLAGKTMKSNFIFDKISGFVDKFTNFANGIYNNQNVQMTQPVQNVQTAQVVQNVQTAQAVQNAQMQPVNAPIQTPISVQTDNVNNQNNQ